MWMGYMILFVGETVMESRGFARSRRTGRRVDLDHLVEMLIHGAPWMSREEAVEAASSLGCPTGSLCRVVGRATARVGVEKFFSTPPVVGTGKVGRKAHLKLRSHVPPRDRNLVGPLVRALLSPRKISPYQVRRATTTSVALALGITPATVGAWARLPDPIGKTNFSDTDYVRVARHLDAASGTSGRLLLLMEELGFNGTAKEKAVNPDSASAREAEGGGVGQVEGAESEEADVVAFLEILRDALKGGIPKETMKQCIAMLVDAL